MENNRTIEQKISHLVGLFATQNGLLADRKVVNEELAEVRDLINDAIRGLDEKTPTGVESE